MAADYNTTIISEFRDNAGRVGGFFAGKPLLLLHTTGARSGEPRVHPLMYQQLTEGIAVFASNGGQDASPNWLHNVRANPMVRVELGNEAFSAVARLAEPDERERIWARQKEAHPQFAAYEAGTTREIPVVVLDRVA